MKKIKFLLVFLALCTAGFAQKKSPNERANNFVNSIEKDFNLSPTQKQKLKVMTTNSINQFDKLEEKAMDPKTEKKVSREVKYVVKDTEDGVETILNEESKKNAKSTKTPPKKSVPKTKPTTTTAKNSSVKTVKTTTTKK